MKPNPIFVAAAGFAMLGACSVTTKNDNAAESDENGAAATASEGNVLPMTDNEAQSGEADTLGNQLNQLNADSGEATSNATDQQ